MGLRNVNAQGPKNLNFHTDFCEFSDDCVYPCGSHKSFLSIFREHAVVSDLRESRRFRRLSPVAVQQRAGALL